MMDQDNVHNILNLLQKSEILGENVLRDRSELVQMDRIRQKNREALTAIKNKKDNDNIYLCVGNMFIKHPISRARVLINEDQKNVNEHVEKLHRKIKDNVQQIHYIEGKAEEFNGFNLNPLSQSEMQSFNVVLNSIKKLDL